MTVGIPISDWLDMMADSVTINSWLSQDVNAKPSYSTTSTSYKCYIEMKNHLVVDHLGRETLARGRVILNTTDNISVKDKITLPSQYVPRNPPMLAVNIQTDELGDHHVTIEIG